MQSAERQAFLFYTDKKLPAVQGEVRDVSPFAPPMYHRAKVDETFCKTVNCFAPAVQTSAPHPQNVIIK